MDPASTALATAIGGVVVAGLTEVISQFGVSIGKAIPGWIKPILAAVVASGAVGVANIHPFAGTAAWVPIANQAAVWALGALIHDIGLS